MVHATMLASKQLINKILADFYREEPPMKKTVLYTAGYEGIDLESFIKRLKENDVEYLIDIRERPLSRKKGFSKKALNQFLSEAGITYLHFPELGSPSEIRKKVREDGDYSYFFKQFSRHLKDHQSKLEDILKVIKTSISCLLCFEKDHEKCHRKMVAEEVFNLNGGKMLLKHL